MASNNGLHFDFSSTPRPSTEDNNSPCFPSRALTRKPQFQNSVCSIDCPVCCKIFTNPKLLPCFHSCCAECIQVEITSGYCRQCNAKFPLPLNGVEGLITDYPIVSFIESLKGLTFHCSMCRMPERGPAAARCIFCGHFLCDVCEPSTECQRLTGHRVIEIPKDSAIRLSLEKRSTKPRTMAEPQPCPFHFGKLLALFCGECSLLICSQCAVDLHKTHRSILASDFAEANFLTLLQRTLDDKNNRLNELASSSSQIKDNLLRINKQYFEIINKINESYSKVMNTMKSHYQNEIKNLNMNLTQSIVAIQDTHSTILEVYNKTLRETDFSRRLLKDTSARDCLQFRKLLYPICARTTEFIPQRITRGVKFTMEDQDVLSFLYSAVGRVECEANGITFDLSNGHDMNALASLVKMTPQAPPSFLPSVPVSNDNTTQFCTSRLRDCSKTTLTMRKPSHQMAPLQFYSVRSSVDRQIISYRWRFGRYGSLQGQFAEACGVAVNEEDEILVADSNNNRIQVFDKTGQFKLSFGNCLSRANDSKLTMPNSVAVTRSKNIVVVERSPTHQIQLFRPCGQFVRKFGFDVLCNPRAVTADHEGNIIVIESKVMRIVIFNSLGNMLHAFNGSASLYFPVGIAVNEKKEIFVCDNRSHRVVVYNYSGTVLRTIGNELLTRNPIAVMLDKNDNVLIADNYSSLNVTVFNQKGELIGAYESKVKHSHCYDAALSPDGRTVVLSSKDYYICGYYVGKHPSSS